MSERELPGGAKRGGKGNEHSRASSHFSPFKNSVTHRENQDTDSTSGHPSISTSPVPVLMRLGSHPGLTSSCASEQLFL